MTDRSSDQIVTKLLAKYMPKNKLIVDIGASDGLYNSNSFSLIEDGWSAILIEPNPKQFIELSQRYIRNKSVVCLNAAVSEADKLIKLFGHPNDGDGFSTGNHGGSILCLSPCSITWNILSISYATLINIVQLNHIGILSIDTEGYDCNILQGLFDTTKERPEVVITENFYNDKEKLFQKHRLMIDNGYELFLNNNVDSIYILGQTI